MFSKGLYENVIENSRRKVVRFYLNVLNASVAEVVFETTNRRGAENVGSNPTRGTKLKKEVFMNEKELRTEIGIGENDLIDSPLGLVDILSVKNEIVRLGYLANGKTQKVKIEDFLNGFVR